jgi:serine/threonine-protein kinase
VLPLVALADEKKLPTGISAAMRVTAVAGAISVLGLFIATLTTGAVCIGCLGTYAVVLSWCVLAWLSTRAHGFAAAPNGILWAGGLLIASYALLFFPGTRTPSAVADAGRDAMRAAGQVGTPGAATTPSPTAAKNPRFDGPPTNDPARDEALTRFVESLDQQTRQMMADALLQVEEQKVRTDLPAPRGVIGPANAPVKVVDFTDPLCGHCAGLHGVLSEVRQLVPPGTFAVEPHFYPLDGACNPSVERKWDTDIRCQAVRAQLCLEGDAHALESAQSLIFENQQSLTREKLFELLRGFSDRKKLEDCMASEETQKKLVADIEAGNRLGLEGTPLLYINGRMIPVFPPVVFALILTHGATKHPAFRPLPEPKPQPAGGSHAGHAH